MEQHRSSSAEHIASPVSPLSPERTVLPKRNVIPSHQGPPMLMVPSFFSTHSALCFCRDTRLNLEAVSLARTSRTVALGDVVREMTIFAPQLMSQPSCCHSVATAFLCKVCLCLYMGTVLSGVDGGQSQFQLWTGGSLISFTISLST